MAILMLIHPDTGDVNTFKKGEGHLAVEAYRDGYRALRERTNKHLDELAKAPARAA